MIIDGSGIMRFEYIANKKIILPETIDEQLVGGLLRAIDTFASEVGGALQTLALGVEKLSYRSIYITEDVSFLLVVSDDQRALDDVIYLKSEYVVRTLLAPIENMMVSSSNFDLSLELLVQLFHSLDLDTEMNEIVNSDNAKKLLKKVLKLKSPHEKFEKSLNNLLNDLPSNQVLLDPSLIMVDRKYIVVPATYSQTQKDKLKTRLIEVVTPILGERYIQAIFD